MRISWIMVAVVSILSISGLVGLEIVTNWNKPYREVCSKTDDQKAMESAATMCHGKIASFHMDSSSNPIVECM